MDTGGEAPIRWLPRGADFERLVAVGVFYAATAIAVLTFATVGRQVVPVWPAAGFAFAALLLGGVRLWPGVLLGAWAAALTTGTGPLTALAIAAGNTLAAMTGTEAMRRLGTGVETSLDPPRYFTLLLVGALLAPGIAATLGSAVLAAAGLIPWAGYSRAWQTWWLGDALGIALVTPLLLAIAQRRWPADPKRHALPLAAYLVLFLLIHAVVFLGAFSHAAGNQVKPLVLFPLLMWCAVSFGVAATALSTVLSLGLALVGVMRETGFFADDIHATGLMQFAAFFATLGLTSMTLTLVIDQSRRQARQLEEGRRLLAESESHFRSLAQSAAVLIWFSGTDGKCTWFNDAWLAFTGRRMDQELGDGWLAGVHPDDTGHCLATYRECFAERQPFTMEYRLRHHSGGYRWIVDHGAPRYDEHGEFLGFAGSCWEIGAQVQAREALEEQQRLLVAIYDATEVGIFLLDRLGRISHLNRRMAEMFDWPADLMRGSTYLDHVHPDHRDLVRTRIFEGLTGRVESSTADCRYWRRDGSEFWGHVNGRRLKDAAGETSGLVGVIADITVRREAEQRQRLAARVFDAISEGVMVTDAKQTIISVNQAFSRITGYPADRVVGRRPTLLTSGRHPPEFYAGMWRAIEETGAWEGEIWNRHAEGHPYPEWLSIATVRDSGGRVTNYVGIFSDISERKAAEEHIRHLAQHDQLTGLPNRHLLYDRLGQTLAAGRRYGRRFAVLFIDLDEFKPVNDTYGHDVGDNLLCEVANRLRGCVRAADTVARHGGDEFVVLAPEIGDREEIARLGEKLLEVVGAPYPIGPHILRVTPSIGVAVYPDHGDDTDSLMRAADRAMYRVKGAGRNALEFA